MATKKKPSRKKTTKKKQKRVRKAPPPSGLRKREPRQGKFAQLFSGAPRDLRKLASDLHALVTHVLRGAEETIHVDWRVAVFTLKNEVCGIQPGPEFVKLYFQRALDLDDPDELLEGVGKNVRHVKLYPDEPFPEASLRKLLVQARKLDG